MLKLKYISIISAFLAPLVATSVNAQISIDILGVYQTEELCKNNPSLRDHRLCRAYYRRNPTRRSRSPSTQNSCRQTIARLEELDRQGVEQATVKLPSGGTITDSPDDLIDDVRVMCNSRSNATNPRSRSTNSAPIDPDFVKALQECNKRWINGYIDGRRASNLSIPPQILQRARECGAI